MDPKDTEKNIQTNKNIEALSIFYFSQEKKMSNTSESSEWKLSSVETWTSRIMKEFGDAIAYFFSKETSTHWMKE